MLEVVQEICLSGFDPDGEPVIRVMSDGTLYVVFEFIPPSSAYEEEHDSFDERDFDRQMEDALGVAVVWEDRELFLIPHPQADTIERIRSFIEGYRRRQ